MILDLNVGRNMYECLIATLFLQFKNDMNARNLEERYESKKILLDEFQRVFQSNPFVKSKDYRYDSDVIEVISRLASKTEWMNSFLELMDLYFSYFKIKEPIILSVSEEDFVFLLKDNRDNVKFSMFLFSEDCKKYFIPSWEYVGLRQK